MTRKRKPKIQPLKRGDRVVLSDGRAASVILPADKSGNVLVWTDLSTEHDQRGVLQLAPGQRYDVVPATSLVRA